MECLSVAVSQAQLSALLARVEGGQEVVITRRGGAIARIAGTVLNELRRNARY